MGQNPEKIAKLFLTPGALIICIVGGIATFVCFVFFLASIVLAIIDYIKA